MKTFALLSLVLVTASAAHADEPLPPPQTHTVCSENKRFCAESDVKKGLTLTDTQTGDVLWRSPKWYRDLHVANDGQYVVAGHDGLGLLPLLPKGPVAHADTVVLTFLNKGQVLREVSLKEVVPSLDLQRTVSHYRWGHVSGFDAKQHLTVVTHSKALVLFDVKTGKRIK